MNVRELIQLLSELDPDLEVWGYEPVEIDAARCTRVEGLMTPECFTVHRGERRRGEDKLWIEYPWSGSQ